MELSIRYINAKYDAISREELIVLRKDIASELNQIKNAKSDVFKMYPGVHGRFQHSQLDVLDIREQKVCAMLDNIDKMIATR